VLSIGYDRKWVINQSFGAARTSDPVLRLRGDRETPFIEEVRERYAQRYALVPWKPEPPTGARELLSLARDGRAVTA